MPMQDNINEIYRMHQEALDRERQEREAEIVRLDLQLLAYARTHATLGDDYRRQYALLNAKILYYVNTYGTKAQERLKELRGDAREKFQERAQELAEAAGIKDTNEVAKLREQVQKQVRLYGEMLSYYRDRLKEANDIGDVLCYTLDQFTDRHPEHAEEIKALIDISKDDLEEDDEE